MFIRKYGVKSGLAEKAANLILDGNWDKIDIGGEATVLNNKLSIRFKGFSCGKIKFFNEGKITNRITGKCISWEEEQPKLLTFLKLKRWYKNL